METSGFIEYSVGGHTCARPAAVQQGKCDDYFEVAPHEGNQLVWRATSIPAKQLKASNVASHFTYGNLVEGPLVLVLRLTTKKDFVDVVYTPFLDLPCVDPTWFFLNLVLPFHLRSGDSASTPRRRL